MQRPVNVNRQGKLDSGYSRTQTQGRGKVCSLPPRGEKSDTGFNNKITGPLGGRGRDNLEHFMK